MSYCLNPKCPNPADPKQAHNRNCRHCGSLLVLQGRYWVKRLLGEGGFGKTFEIEDQGTSKVLKVLVDNNPKAVSLFEREAEVLKQLKHPGIPRIEPDGYFTFCPPQSQQPLHCLVMERIEGGNLEEWMNERNNQPIPLNQAITWLKQLCEILDRVHQQQYFHRDIKPKNIMRRPNGQLVLIDFGSVREVSGTYLAKVGGGHRITGIVSPGYTPPEQANGKAVPQSDFFALGRTFAYLLTGFDPNDLHEDTRTGQLKWRDRATQVSTPLADLIDYLMAPFPGNRPQNTQVILQRLEEIERAVHNPGWQPMRRGGEGRSPQAVGQAYAMGSLSAQPSQVQPRSSKYNKKRRSTKHSRSKHKKAAKLTQKLLAGAALLLFAGTATQVYGVLDLPSLSKLVSIPTTSQAALSRAAEEPALYGRRVSVQNKNSSSKNFALAKTLPAHVYGVNSVAISPDAQVMVSGSVDKSVKIWNLTTGELLRTLNGHSQQVWSVAINPDGKTIASGSGDGTIKLWDTKTGELLRTLQGDSGWVFAVAFSPDGQTLASGSVDNSIKLWQVSTGKLIRTLSGHTNRVSSVAFSPDGLTLASGSYDNTINLWYVSTGLLLRTLEGNSHRVLSVAISPDGQTVAGGIEDGTIRLWEVSTGEPRSTLYAYSDPVQSVAFTPDGLSLVSGGGSLESTIKLWKVGTGELLQTLSGHSDKVHSVAIAQDGKMLTSGSEDNTIKVWRLQ